MNYSSRNIKIYSTYKNKKINLCESINKSIQSINKYKNEICLISGSLYLIGEVLNLN